MRICMAGSGNTATVLCKLMIQKGHSVVQVLSRHKAHAEILAAKTGASYGDFSAEPDESVDIIIIAVADSALTAGALPLKTGGKLVVHTAGAISRQYLDEFSKRNGVLYPLQSLRKELPELPEIPFLVDGSDDETLKIIFGFAKTLSSTVQAAGDEERLKLHTAAVIVNNFTNHLYALAHDFCIAEKLEFSLLLPLIKETANRIDILSPSNAQTGPAVRSDLATINTHLNILEHHPGMRELYSILSESIRRRHAGITGAGK